jgi:hypothetical protein
MVRSEKTEKPDQPEGLEFTDNSRGRSILRAIKKHLDEQPAGVSRRGAIQTYVVVDKGIISDKGFKNYFSQFLKEGKVEKIEGGEAKRLTGQRWPLYCLPDWAKKEQIKKVDIEDLKKSRRRWIADVKTMLNKVDDFSLVVAIWNEYSKLSDLNARLRIRQEFTGDRASPELESLARETVPKMIDDFFTIFKKVKSKKRKNKMLDGLLDLMADEPLPAPIGIKEIAKDQEFSPSGVRVFVGDTTKNRLLPNMR